MVPKVCCKSHGQPVPGVRSAAMISSSRAISREGVIARSTTEGTRTADHTMLAARLEQKPAALFGFINEILQKASGRHVLVLVGNLVGRAHVVDLRLIVVHELQ